MFHFIQCEATIQGRRETYFVERDCDRLGLSNTVADILHGQVEGVRKVYRAELRFNWFEDVSEEIAQAVLDEADGPLPPSAIDFCEEHLGCVWVANAVREINQTHGQFGVGA